MASHPPTPNPPRDQLSTQPSISDEINAATRKQHTELNRFIIGRLPLALPPHALDPAMLGQGLASFAKIFFIFEAVWDALEDTKTAQAGDYFSGSKDSAMIEPLKRLRPKGMKRSQRLGADLKHIEDITGKDFSRHGSGELPVGRGLKQNPHLLLAYAWVMYMAVFSGGRWVRKQLQAAGPDFWKAANGNTNNSAKSGSTHTPGFSFLFFDSEEDGEDIKREFKKRLAETETLLTAQERQEVVQAAQELFEHCIALVHRLDGQVVEQKMLQVTGVAMLLGLLLLGIAVFYWFAQHR